MNSTHLPTQNILPYAPYLNALGAVNLIEELEISLHDFIRFVQNIPMDITDAEGKWNIKEIIQHVIDTERIFGYRALRISRKRSPLL
jgi:hypothetical protein